MAAVHTSYQTMTLGNQQHKMFNVLHHSPTNQANCVIVSTGLPPPQSKTVIQSKRPLAPAPEKPILTQNTADVLRCKRKINFVPYSGPGHQPASVARRNARERNRVKQVNNGFATLRQHIPASVAAALTSPASSSSASSQTSSSSSSRGASKKLSKVETLRMAVEYIRSLQRMLEEFEGDVPQNLEGLNQRYFAAGQDDGQLHQMQVLSQHTPPCSEASSSPTPSFSSESSLSATSSYANTQLYHTENYENYDPASPADEELLDVISWWQQQ